MEILQLFSGLDPHHLFHMHEAAIHNFVTGNNCIFKIDYMIYIYSSLNDLPLFMLL